MPLIAELAPKSPINPNGSVQAWTRKVKYFEGSNVATLETAINNWIAAEALLHEYMAVGSIDYVGSKGNTSRVLVSYGYFTPA